MQSSLNNFLGFGINKKVSFNPFFGNVDAVATASESDTAAVAAVPVPKKLPLTNLLDSPLLEGNESKPMALFPAAKPTSVIPVTEEEPEMIQPKAKDGKRLLYKHPKIPRVGVKGCYSLLVGESDRSEAAWLIQFDGAANPNPGPASAGAVLWSPKDLEGKRIPVFESGKFLGKATNNIAEVQGLLLGLQIAAMRGARELLIEGDSELIIFQQTGRYKVSDRNLKVWWANIQAAMMDETSFDWIAIRQVPREQNERADSITKEVLGRKQSFQRA